MTRVGLHTPQEGLPDGVIDTQEATHIRYQIRRRLRPHSPESGDRQFCSISAETTCGHQFCFLGGENGLAVITTPVRINGNHATIVGHELPVLPGQGIGQPHPEYPDSGVDAGHAGGVWSAGFFARLNISNRA